MIRDLPVRFDGVADYSFQVELDGTVYGFNFHWNDRDGYWYFDVLDASLNPMLTSRRVVLNWPLLHVHKQGGGLPAGDILAWDSSGKHSPPGLLELGDRVRLLYYEAADIASLLAS